MYTIIRKVKQATLLGCLLSVLALSSNSLQASTITTNCLGPTSCTLAELFAGGTMQVSSGYSTMLFYNFQLEQLISTTSTNLSLITVTGLDTGNVGFRINGNGQLAITNTNFISLKMGYDAASLSGHGSIANLLAIGGSATGSGMVQVDDAVFNGQNAYMGGLQAVIDPYFGSNQTSDKLDTPKIVIDIIEKNILVQGKNAGDTAQITFIDQRHQVSEPASLGLFGLGLAVIWMGNRRVVRSSI